MRRLIGRTAVTNPATGGTTILEPGQELPEWAAGQIGDHLLDGTPPDRPEPARPATPTAAALTVALSDEDVERIGDRLLDRLRELLAELDGGGTSTPPVMEQPDGNASNEEWRAWAEYLGVPAVEVADLGRKHIQELLKRRADEAAVTEQR